MSSRWVVGLLARFGWPALFRRAPSHLWIWVLAGSFGLCLAAPARAGDVRPRELRVCVRPPGVPADLDRWAYSTSGKLITDRWALKTGKAREITVYVFDRNAPSASATYFPRRFGDLKCPAKVAPKKNKPDAARKKKELAARKKKEAEEREEEREEEERKPEKREGKAQEVKKPRPTKETEEGKQERERRKHEAQEEERHRQHERDRPQVLPRQGVTAAWRAQVLPPGKSQGVTAAWPTKVLPTAKVALGPVPMSTLCGAKGSPAPQLAGGKNSAATMAVREPILKALIAYKAAKSEAEKEVFRQKLRGLFESIGAPAAQPFRAMLETRDVLAVAVRDGLRNDPLRNELVGILEKKYMPAQCAQAAPSPAPQAAAGPEGVTLPAVSLTDEGAFDELHALLQQRMTAIHEGCNRIVRLSLLHAKEQLLLLVPVLSERLTRAQRVKVAAFKETDATKKAAGLKRAGALYAGALVFSQLVQFYVNIGLVTDGADAMGLPAGFTENEAESPLLKPLEDFRQDNDIIALTQASLDADVLKMAAALPAGSKAYERHVLRLDRWIAAIHRGAVLSKKVIQVADIALIAISIYQVAKTPVVPAGSSPTPPPTILGTLPGGAAVSSAVSLPSLARALEAIRKLVALGALDGAVVAGVGSLGGGSGIALPKLQRPTSLAVQVPPTELQPSMSNGGSAGSSKPQYRPNPAHNKGDPRYNPRKTPEPEDAAEVFERAVEGERGFWYGRGKNGEIYRFSPDNSGGAHFSGMTGGKDGIQLRHIPIEIRRALGRVK